MLKIVDIQEHDKVDWYEKDHLAGQIYCLSLVTYGKCVYWVNEQKQIMEKGEMLLIPAHLAYYGKSIPTMMHTKLVIYFQIEQPDLALSILHQPEPLRLKLGCYDLIHEKLKMIILQWTEHTPYYELMTETLLMQLLIEISREYDQKLISGDKHQLVDMMKHYIQRNYNHRITKEQLGEVIERTPNYAANLFKSVTNQTISDYVHHQRMKRAVYMLTESQLTIAEIAEFLGYRDLSYFYRVFKRMMGTVPSELMHDRPPIL